MPPYVDAKTRAVFNHEFRLALDAVRDCEPGELCYALTRLVDTWLGSTPTYDDFAVAIGVLETAKLELYRRRVAPYEDFKRTANGDVYSENKNASSPLGRDYTQWTTRRITYLEPK